MFVRSNMLLPLLVLAALTCSGMPMTTMMRQGDQHVIQHATVEYEESDHQQRLFQQATKARAAGTMH